MTVTFDIRRAIAAVKAFPAPAQSVLEKAPAGPVILDLGNGLAVAYLVDIDDCFVWVQARHFPLLYDLWDESLARLVPNGAVAALPTRDVLAFCDAGSVQGIEELWKLVANKGVGLLGVRADRFDPPRSRRFWRLH